MNAPDAGTGCTSGAQCSSGVCLPSHSCATCQGDAECAEGLGCGTGVCSDACVTAATCAPGRACCGGRCVDPQVDPAHCGACNQSCASGDFCARAACRRADFSGVCQLTLATVILDQNAQDDTAGTSMASALASTCIPPMTARSVGQEDAGVLRIDGAPLALGELLVLGGGSYRQRAVRWLEDSNEAQVRDTSTTQSSIYSLRDGGVVSSVPSSMLGPTRDRLLVQIVRAPSGSLVLHAAGFYGPGTLAAAYAFAQTILPQRASLSTCWYVIEWEELDGLAGPSAGDRYTPIASGP